MEPTEEFLTQIDLMVEEHYGLGLFRTEWDIDPPHHAADTLALA